MPLPTDTARSTRTVWSIHTTRSTARWAARRCNRSPLRLLVPAALAVVMVLSPAAAQARPEGGPGGWRNLVVNGSFERPPCQAGVSPAGWRTEAWQTGAVFACDSTTAHWGRQSVRIEAPVLNDARWLQTVTVRANTTYRLSAWIKTRDVTHTPELHDAGANIGFWGTYDHSPGLFGTNDWTYVSVTIDSGDRTELTVAARLGYWSGTATGTAWFDDVRLVALRAQP